MKRLIRHMITIGIGALAAGLCATAQAQVANVIQENFTGDSVNNPWIALGGACLTAGDSSTTIANGIGIPACVNDPYYTTNPNTGNSDLPLVGLPSSGTSPDAIGSGALRLTNGGNQGLNESGAIISANPFPSTQGLQVTFTTYTYGGNAYGASNGTNPGADGIGFYLIDAGQYANSGVNFSGPDLGAFGGSLGYSCSNTNAPYNGMTGAYIGLGIDEYGNFLNYNDNTSTGQTVTPTNEGQQNPGEIGLRGAGNINWTWLNQNYSAYYPNSLSASDQQRAVQATCQSGMLWDYSNPSSPQQTTVSIPDYAVIPGSAVTLLSSDPISSQENNSNANRLNATPITYQMILTSSGLLSFAYDYGKTTFNPTDSTTVQVLNQQSITSGNGTIPSNFLFGFGGSTGGGTNVHEITCFEASPAARTVGAPVAPLTVSSGSLLYTLTSNPSPVQGYVTSYALSASGSPATTPSWEAGALMTDTLRQGGLYSTASDGQSPALLTALDTAAFGLSNPSTCVPNTSTIVNYTIDPNAAYSPTPSGCTTAYLGPRAVGSLLDEFSPGDAAGLLTPPNNAFDLSLPGYTTFAAAEATRPQALLFTNDDGFLYSVSASTGQMNWGWMPRSFVSQLQNYTAWPYQDNFAGNFAVTDASTTTAGVTTWGTYIVGSANGGALWYDLALDKNGNPTKVVTTALPPQPTMPANTQALPSGTLTYPQRQAPVVGTIGSNQIAAFVVNATTGSTTTSSLVEFNVATGQASSAAIPASVIGNGYVHSNLFYDANSSELFFGNSVGSVYAMSFTGSASTDIGNIGSLGTTEDGLPVNYVGYQQLKNQPYLWAASSTGMTVFGINNTGWNPLWATAVGTAYAYNNGVWAATTTANPAALQTGATISDLPIVVNGVLVVPTFVAPGNQTCNSTGEGYYDFFNLPNGTFPQNTVQQNGKYLTGNLDIGQGAAYSPSYSISSTGLPVYGSSQSSQNPISPLIFSRSGINTVVQWRVH